MAMQQCRQNNESSKIECVGCAKVLEMGHLGVKCLQGHDICSDCAKNFVSAVFEDPEKNIPVKCMICKGDVVAATFERQLQPKQFDTFLLHQYKNNAFCAEDEMIVSCPHCSYWEINEKHDGAMMMYCKKERCKKVSCLYCHKQIRMRPHAQDEVDQKDLEGHFECARLGKWKNMWEDGIHRGVTVPCPKCGVSGQKNNACTHMTCPACATEWCYVCGLSIEDLDKHPDFPNFFGHNEEWKTNPARCPLWFDNVCEVDDRWPKDNSDACVEFFHQLRLKAEVKKVLAQIPADKFRALAEKYNIDQNCGLDLKQVKENDHVIIKR